MSGRNGGAKGWDEIHTACDTSNVCASLPAGGEVGCVARCMSPRCSMRAYGPLGLEAGEVPSRALAGYFRECLRASERPLRRAGLWPPRLNGESEALYDTDEADDVYFATAFVAPTNPKKNPKKDPKTNPKLVQAVEPVAAESPVAETVVEPERIGMHEL